MSHLIKMKSAVIVTKKSQRKLVLPTNLHEQLIYPFFPYSEEELCLEGEMENGAEKSGEQEDISFETDNKTEEFRDHSAVNQNEPVILQSTIYRIEIDPSPSRNSLISKTSKKSKLYDRKRKVHV